MNLITLDPYSIEQQTLVKNSRKEQALNEILEIPKLYNKEEYNSFKERSNEILECIIQEHNGKITNYCIYTGTKDNRLVQMIFDNPNQKDFLQKAQTYAFSVLAAHTITIFSNKQNLILENDGFENLGEEEGITTYIKENEINMINNIKRTM